MAGIVSHRAEVDKMKNSRNSIVSKNSFFEVYFSLSPCLPMCLSICPFLSFAFICFLFDFTCATVSKAFEAHSHGITVNWIEISAALGDIVAAFFRFLHSRLSYKRSLKRPFLFLLLPRQIHRIRFYRQLLNFILEFPCVYIQLELIENRKHQTSVAHRKVRRREKIKRTNRMRISKEFEILRACVLQESNKNNHVFRIRNWIFLIFCRVFPWFIFPELCCLVVAWRLFRCAASTARRISIVSSNWKWGKRKTTDAFVCSQVQANDKYNQVPETIGTSNEIISEMPKKYNLSIFGQRKTSTDSIWNQWFCLGFHCFVFLGMHSRHAH